jgi:hypothetical protein
MHKDGHAVAPRKASPSLLLALCALCLAASACERSANTNTAAGGAPAGATPAAGARKEFTEAEVAEIRTLLNGVDPSRYRVTLPEYRDSRLVGSQTYGNLSVAEVTRITSARGLKLDDKGSTVIVLVADEGGGEGSHTPSQSTSTSSGDGSGGSGGSAPPTGGGEAGMAPSRGRDRVSFEERMRRLEALFSKVDRSQYAFIR